MNHNLVEQSYWDDNYEKCNDIIVAREDSPIRQWLTRFFNNAQGTCFEVGCFPGTYLSIFGELGYELYGIDLTPRVETDLPLWLKNRGYKVGKFFQADFLKYNDENKYDIVSSFGFIEHFINWDDILIKQARLVKEGGYLVVQIPNFRGFIQRTLHIFLDKENYNLHNISSMNPDLWANIIRKMDFEIVYYGYFGAFHFWIGKQSRNIIQKASIALIRHLLPFLKKIPKDRMVYSPYCGLIAKKGRELKL